MTEKERMLSQQLYMASDPELVRERKEAKRLTRLINDSTEDQAEYRIQLFKELFGKVGKNICPYHIPADLLSVISYDRDIAIYKDLARLYRIPYLYLWYAASHHHRSDHSLFICHDMAGRSILFGNL